MLDTLTWPLLCEMFLYLHPKDISNLLLVCKDLYTEATQSLMWNFMLKTKYPQFIPYDNDAKYLRKHYYLLYSNGWSLYFEDIFHDLEVQYISAIRIKSLGLLKYRINNCDNFHVISNELIFTCMSYNFAAGLDLILSKIKVKVFNSNYLRYTAHKYDLKILKVLYRYDIVIQPDSFILLITHNKIDTILWLLDVKPEYSQCMITNAFTHGSLTMICTIARTYPKIFPEQYAVQDITDKEKLKLIYQHHGKVKRYTRAIYKY